MTKNIVRLNAKKRRKREKIMTMKIISMRMMVIMTIMRRRIMTINKDDDGICKYR